MTSFGCCARIKLIPPRWTWSKGPLRGFLFEALQMPIKYSMAFFDAQNLFRSAMRAFQDSGDGNCCHPNFVPVKLHSSVAAALGIQPRLTRLYTGVSKKNRSPEVAYLLA